MKRNWVMRLVYILALCTVLLLCGCSKRGEENTGSAVGSEELAGGRFVSVSMPLDNTDARIYRLTRTPGGALLLCKTFTGELSLYSADFDAGTLEKTLELDGISADTAAFCGETLVITSKTDDGGTELTTVSGSDISSVPLMLPDMLRDEYFLGFWLGDGNNTLVQTPGKLYRLDIGTGDCEQLEAYDGEMDILSDGMNGFSAVNGRENDTVISLLDGCFSTTEKFTVSATFEEIYTGVPGDRYSLCVRKVGQIRLLDIRSGEYTDYANLQISGADSYTFSYIDGDRFLSSRGGVPAVWTRSTESDVITLTLATCSDPDEEERNERLIEAVSEFNAQSEKYNIEIVDYAIYNDTADSSPGMDRFRIDILAGDTPDIYDIWSMPAQKYWANGLTEDLYPFFEKDEELSADGLVQSVLHALEHNGRLYDLVPSYRLTMVYGNRDIFSGHITIQDLLEMNRQYSATQIFGDDMSRGKFWRNVLSFSGKDYVDPDSGSCSFDSPEFIGLLEFSAQLPEKAEYLTYEPGRLYVGDQFVYIRTTGDLVEEWQFTNAQMAGKERFIGFPTRSGSGVSIQPCLRLAMSGMSTEKDGVWEFFRFLLSDAYQWTIDDLSIRRSQLEATVDYQIKAYAELEIRVMIDLGGTAYVQGGSVPVSAPPAELGDELLGIVDKVDGVNEYDAAIYDIVINEAEKFYAGQNTAAQTAQAIQSRASIYLSEQF